MNDLFITSGSPRFYNPTTRYYLPFTTTYLYIGYILIFGLYINPNLVPFICYIAINKITNHYFN